MINKIKNYYFYLRDKRYDTLAGTLSFFFILSFIPLLYLCLSLYVKLGSFWNIETPLPEILTKYISFDLNAGVSFLFIITTIYSSSALFLQIRRTGELIYNVKKPQAPLKNKLLACGLVLLTMVVVSILLLAFSIAQNFLSSILNKVVIEIFTILVIYIVLITLLVLINQYATIDKLTRQELQKGVIFTTIYITLVSIGFFIYIMLFANYDFLYGVFSTIIIAFIYIFLIMKGVVSGIIINQKNYKKSR